MSYTIDVPKFASSDFSNAARFLNGKVGATATISRVSEITGLEGRTVHLKEALKPAPRFRLTINGTTCSLGMTTPPQKNIDFDLLDFDKKESDDNTVVFENRDFKPDSFSFEVENSKTNRIAGSGKFANLILDMDCKIIAGIDMRENKMSEKMIINIKGARAVDL